MANKGRHIHITIHDEEVDRRNGRKAKGSTWHKKGRKRTGHRRITAHDRAVDRRNGRKARGW